MFIMVKNNPNIVSAFVVYWIRDWTYIQMGPGSNPSQFKMNIFVENYIFPKFFEIFLLY